VEGREREGPQVTVEPGPLRALLRHCQWPFCDAFVYFLRCARVHKWNNNASAKSMYRRYAVDFDLFITKLYTEYNKHVKEKSNKKTNTEKKYRKEV